MKPIAIVPASGPPRPSKEERQRQLRRLQEIAESEELPAEERGYLTLARMLLVQPDECEPSQ